MGSVSVPAASLTGKRHDIVAIGCGPLNLGLAALASSVPDLDVVVVDSRPELRWHPGLMFDGAELQLSFLADLVSLVAPAHPLSFLAYLADVDRLYPFYIRERFHPTRREYESYLRWAAGKLPSLRFSHHVEAVEWSARQRCFVVQMTTGAGESRLLRASNLVLGIGTEPQLPEALAQLPRRAVMHAADYLQRASDVQRARHVTVIGSGQSGAEVVLDLLGHNLQGGPAVGWLTRTRSFAPLDYTKLVLEMTTPAYVRYFHGLAQPTKDRLVAQQWQHYKGISTGTLEQIHDLLYRRELLEDLAPVELRCGVTLEGATVERDGRTCLGFLHQDTGRRFDLVTDLVVAATGYRQRPPAFLHPLDHIVVRDGQGRPRVGLDHAIQLADEVEGRLFVSHADLHSHGVAAPDLGFAAYRNATILNTVAGRPVFQLPRRTAFADFATPPEPPPAPDLTPVVEARRLPRAGLGGGLEEGGAS
jgi:lysine N6-hydroxylase